MKVISQRIPEPKQACSVMVMLRLTIQARFFGGNNRCSWHNLLIFSCIDMLLVYGLCIIILLGIILLIMLGQVRYRAWLSFRTSLMICYGVNWFIGSLDNVSKSSYATLLYFSIYQSTKLNIHRGYNIIVHEHELVMCARYTGSRFYIFEPKTT